jgi:hypothetical protein
VIEDSHAAVIISSSLLAESCVHDHGTERDIWKVLTASRNYYSNSDMHDWYRSETTADSGACRRAYIVVVIAEFYASTSRRHRFFVVRGMDGEALVGLCRPWWSKVSTIIAAVCLQSLISHHS